MFRPAWREGELDFLQAIDRDTLAVVALAAIVIVALVLVTSPGPRHVYRRFRPRLVRNTSPPGQRVHDRGDPSDQLRAVMGANFSTRKIMRHGEYRVFKVVEDIVRSAPGGNRVFAQTSLGEIIESPDRDAHSAINSKRVDILVVGWNGLPLVAIEYQGQGHYQNTAAARDAVKKEALRKAGVQFLEIMDFHSDEDVARLTREALGRAGSQQRVAS